MFFSDIFAFSITGISKCRKKSKYLVLFLKVRERRLYPYKFKSNCALTVETACSLNKSIRKYLSYKNLVYSTHKHVSWIQNIGGNKSLKLIVWTNEIEIYAPGIVKIYLLYLMFLVCHIHLYLYLYVSYFYRLLTTPTQQLRNIKPCGAHRLSSHVAIT